ncbi:MAG: pilin [Gemmatimonadetes bacterium]|nr:pilin [Gemmatimonadota bacterium]
MASVADWLKIIHFQILAVLVLAAVYVGNTCACSTKDKAVRAAVKSDLRNLGTAQEMLWADEGHYALTWSSLDFESSIGVSIVIDGATSTGWSARGTHPAMRWTCAIYVGDAPRPREDAVEGEVVCWE